MHPLFKQLLAISLNKNYLSFAGIPFLNRFLLISLCYSWPIYNDVTCKNIINQVCQYETIYTSAVSYRGPLYVGLRQGATLPNRLLF